MRHAITHSYLMSANSEKMPVFSGGDKIAGKLTGLRDVPKMGVFPLNHEFFPVALKKCHIYLLIFHPVYFRALVLVLNCNQQLHGLKFMYFHLCEMHFGCFTIF